MAIVKGKRYLVTGGSGFLGQSLIERIINQGGIVRTIVRNEGKLLLLKERFGNSLEIYFGDVSNRFAVNQCMQGEIEGVFHLAAFKHVPLAEKFCIECITSNVFGSMSILDVGSKKGVKFIIGISTDKAAQVVGVYGATKLLMERLFQQYETIYPKIAYRIVRYGNVLYSTGSVLCKWKDLIKEGKQVVVTDRKATRFFWSAEQAVDLIFNCLENAKDSTPYVPEMKAICVGDLLEAMILKYNLNESSIPIKEIGLQKGENLHEKVLEAGPYSNEVELYSVSEIQELI